MLSWAQFSELKRFDKTFNRSLRVSMDVVPNKPVRYMHVRSWSQPYRTRLKKSSGILLSISFALHQVARGRRVSLAFSILPCSRNDGRPRRPRRRGKIRRVSL